MHISKIIKQKKGEHVIMMLRRHPFALVPALLLFLLINAFAIGAYFFVAKYYPNMLITDTGRATTIILLSTLLLSTWIQFYGQFIDYYLDIWVVTDTRIINVEQHGLFGRTVAETDLYKIQDVESDIKGFIPTTFSYGYVHIQSAGEHSKFLFEQVPYPHLVRKKIIQLVQVDRKKHAAEAMAAGV